MPGWIPRILALVLLSPLAPPRAGAEAPPAAPLASPHHWEQVSLDFEVRLAAARGRYAEKLEAMYARYRESGDLDAVLAVRGERARLQKHGLPVAADLVAQPPELAALQDLALRQYARWQEERAAALTALARDHLRDLSAREKELTREDRIEEALAVRREIESWKGHPDIGPRLARMVAEEPPPAPVQPSVAAPVLANRLRMWEFEEGRGTLSLPKEGVQPLHLSGVEWTDGRKGGGLLLDGLRSRVRLDAADWKTLSATNSFTLSAWIRVADLQTTQPVFSRQTEARKGWVMTINTAGNVVLELRGGGEKLRLVSKDALTSQTWHHLAMSLDVSSGGTSAEVHVDGLSSATGAAPWRLEENDLPLLIGAYRWSASYNLHFDGRLDSVVLCSPALDGGAIREMSR